MKLRRKHFEWFLNVLVVIGIITLILAKLSCAFIETDQIFAWLLKHFALPVAVLLLIICLYFNIRYTMVIESWSSKQKLKYWSSIVLKSIAMAFGVSLMVLTSIFAMTILINVYCGKEKTILVSGRVTRFNEYTNRKTGELHYFINIYDKALNRHIDIETDQRYQIGDTIYKSYYVGYFGLLYTKREHEYIY